jgi:arsenate reductase
LLQHFHRDLAKKDLSDDALIDLMIQYPDLIQRPIVEKRERAILTRAAERVNDLLSGASLARDHRS